MIADLHSHILPELDDGSASVEESLAMLEMLREQGITTVVATPHFYAHRDRPETFLAKRAAAMELLREAAKAQPELPNVLLGAEVYYYPGMSGSEELRQLTIDDSGYILVEMPMGKWTDRMYEELVQLWEVQGLVPVIAHVDRYISPMSTHGIPKRLAQLPVLVQANAGFFLRSSTARMAAGMLKKDQIHLLGSDCHNMHTRIPRLGEAVARIRKTLGPQYLEQIASYQAQILNR